MRECVLCPLVPLSFGDWGFFLRGGGCSQPLLYRPPVVLVLGFISEVTDPHKAALCGGRERDRNCWFSCVS